GGGEGGGGGGPGGVEGGPVALGGIGRDRGGQGDLCRGGGIVSANRARPDSRRQALHDELVGEALGLHQQGNLLGRVVFLEWLGRFLRDPLEGQGQDHTRAAGPGGRNNQARLLRGAVELERCERAGGTAPRSHASAGAEVDHADAVRLAVGIAGRVTIVAREH